ncbi:Arc family DNA-binding protein [Methylorubrum salsuginis]|uniref:Arc family DNA-binding protein n=1 Tax=Methylorubrum salsuginis TaxID=414703 RepID=UPI000B8596EB|nr:Arc family DNA-binding protein [Methylorubrum salsuginis]
MSKPPAPSDTADKFMLRMPDGLRDRLKAEAESNNRSMNAEIIARIEASFNNKHIPDEVIYEMLTRQALSTSNAALYVFVDLVIGMGKNGVDLLNYLQGYRASLGKTIDDGDEEGKLMRTALVEAAERKMNDLRQKRRSS